MRRLLGSLLLFAGGIGIGVWGSSVVRQSLDQKHDEKIFESEQAADRAQTAPLTKSAVPAHPAALPARHSGIVARLSIPRIQLRAMVREGDDDGTLDVALGHIPGTAFPGQRGNVGVAGHRDRLFRRLAEVGKGDEIRLETPSATYRYRVDEMSIVSPKAVSVLAAGRGAELTLVTCYPFYYIGPAPKRYIVKAHLIAPGAAGGVLAGSLP
ncbi:MAG TPA: class D sortase [Bryobacteraceae bacterium]|jgi:sortase A|nr:class D sortase [Bryobacteraceae bacterium]